MTQKNNPRIIGITGTFGAGKDTIADYLKERGYQYHSCSDVVRDECDKLGLPKDRDTLQKVANQLRENFGPAILAKRVLEKINQNKEKKSLVLSIRNPAEVEELKKNKGFLMLAVDAPIEMRYKRIKSRGRIEDSVSFEKFQAQEEFEKKNDNKNSQQLDTVAKMADCTVINDGSLPELYQQVDKIIEKVIKKTKSPLLR